MRSSARSTSPASGFSLVEVMIAATLLATVLGVVLSLFSDASQYSKVAVARAELRRDGMAVLTSLSRDLQCTTSNACGGCSVSATSGSSSGVAMQSVSSALTGAGNMMTGIEFYKVDTTKTYNGTSPQWVQSGGSNVVYRYFQCANDIRTDSKTSTQLLYQFFPTNAQGSAGTTQTKILLSELAPVSAPSGFSSTNWIPGFQVLLDLPSGTAIGPGPLGSAFPTGLFSTSSSNAFSDAPHTLTVTLHLMRVYGTTVTVGSSKVEKGVGIGGGSTRFVADVILTSRIELHPDQNY